MARFETFEKKYEIDPATGKKITDLVNQAKCRHQPSVEMPDVPVVRLVERPSGKQIIVCSVCDAIWLKQDDTEYIHRRGKRISNHTRTGWNEMVLMLSEKDQQRLYAKDTPGLAELAGKE